METKENVVVSSQGADISQKLEYITIFLICLFPSFHINSRLPVLHVVYFECRNCCARYIRTLSTIYFLRNCFRSHVLLHTRNVCKAYYNCFLLKLLLGMYVVYFTIDKPIHIWTMVRVDKTKLYWLLFFYQYQLVFDFILLRYSDLTASSPYLLTWQLVAISYCNAKMSNT